MIFGVNLMGFHNTCASCLHADCRLGRVATVAEVDGNR
jgi:hypothetical protein